MSKLFDQLKNAARDREQRGPGLLIEALQKSTSAAAPEGPTADVAPAQAGAQSTSTPVPEGPTADVAPAQAGAQSTLASPAHPPYTGILAAIAIFAAVLIAWHAAPWRAPAKVKIDPSELKLDRSLDLERPSPKGTTSPSAPS